MGTARRSRCPTGHSASKHCRDLRHVAASYAAMPDTWARPRLAAFRELHQQFCRKLSFTEWAPPADAPAEKDSAQVSPGDIAPAPPPSTSLQHCKCNLGKMMTMLRRGLR